jgi:hypothetical protein
MYRTGIISVPENKLNHPLTFTRELKDGVKPRYITVSAGAVGVRIVIIANFQSPNVIEAIIFPVLAF